MSIKEDLAKLESCLASKLRATYLEVNPIENTNKIEIVVSANFFDTISVQSRIFYCFSLTEVCCPDILDKYELLVKALNSEEMDLFFENRFIEELK